MSFNRSRSFDPQSNQSINQSINQTKSTLDRTSSLAATRPNLNRPYSRQSTESSLPSLDQSINQSFNQSFNQSINRSPSRSTNQSVNRSIIRPPELMPYLTDSEMRDLYTAFQSFDRFDSGSINPTELRSIMLSLGFTKHSNKLIDWLIDEIDIDRQVTFKDFLALMQSHAFSTINQSIHQSKSKNMKNTNQSINQSINPSKIELEYLFSLIDLNNDGYIDESDLSKVFQSLHESINPSDLLSMIECADKNGNGKVSKAEFCEMMTRQID